MEKQALASVKLFHGAFNCAVFIAFLYQASLGLKIRKGRIGQHPDFSAMKRHRTFGPLLALLSISGFLAGVVVVSLDQGRIFKYPPHFLTGLLIAVGVATTFLVSRRIRPGDSPWRRAHALLGGVLLLLYVVQIMLGLGILL